MLGLVKTLLLLQIVVINEIVAWRIFYRGRENGGNLGSPPKQLEETYKSVKEEWFTQTLDHFNPTDTRTWQQRYFVNSNYFNNSNVVFLMIGGEGEAKIDWMTQGAWIDYAKHFGALCFQVEHRYYGKSHPTQDMSVKNLQYLSSEQALADLAQFIVTKNIEFELPSTVSWIAFGGSYSGSLASWVRQKYPHLIQGSIASSAPLLAEINFKEYFEVVDASLATVSSDCVDNVKKSFQDVYYLLNAKPDILNTIFNLCDDITEVNTAKDISNFFTTLAGDFAGVVQYNKDNRIGVNSQISKITIDTICKIMINEELGAAVSRLAEVNKLLLKASNQTCTDYKYETMINQMRNTSWESSASEGGRQWTYQTCTEFGYFQTSDYQPQVFGHSFPASFSIQQCIDIFGSKFNKTFLNNAINRTNFFYGALNVKTSNIFFLQGSIDPWHVLGIQKSTQSIAALLIQGTAHCADMYPASPNDSDELKHARSRILNVLQMFINNN